jgi:hypothetical protein
MAHRAWRARPAARAAGIFVVVAMVATLTSTTVAAATVTRGDLHEFNGYGSTISGHAQMIRTADGRTIVSVHVEGFVPGLTYASHVHAAACAAGLADGHYKFDPAGAAAPPNEIWPGPFTANEAGIGQADTIAEGTAGPTAVSVVIHAPGGAKIACADLQ